MILTSNATKLRHFLAPKREWMNDLFEKFSAFEYDKMKILSWRAASEEFDALLAHQCLMLLDKEVSNGVSSKYF